MIHILKRLLKYTLYFILAVTVFTAGLVTYLVWFQPAFHFPKPTGQHAVGVKAYHWIDTSRRETLYQDLEHPYRELMVKVWYPAQAPIQNMPSTPYAPYAIDYFKTKKPLIWLLVLSRPMYVYAQTDMPLTPDIPQFSVIIFSPGFRGVQDANTAHCEELASQGYIVVSIAHPYDNSVVQFPGGRIADGLKSLAQRSQGSPLEQTTVIDDSAAIWLADTKFVLNQLEQFAHNKNSFFYKRLDLNHIGMFGHSMGGSTALQAVLHDYRIKAAVNLDGALFGYDIPKKIDKPCMVMLAGNGVKFNERSLTQKEWKRYDIKSLEEEKKLKESYLPALDQLAQSTEHDFYTFVVKDAGHFDLSDMALSKSASPLVYLVATINSSLLRMGSIDGFRATEIVNAYLVNFFDKYLKGQPSEVLDGDKKRYSEVETK